jgi:hypothetical protein
MMMQIKSLVMAHVMTLSAAVMPMAKHHVKVQCGWSHQIVPGLDNIVGNFLGLALTLGQLLFVVALALLVLLVATKHGSMLLKIVAGIVVFGLLLRSGWLPVSSPC